MKQNPQKGAALVEFAIVAPVFFAIVFGLIEFGRAYFVVNTLTEMTRRGARVASVCPPTDPRIYQQTLFNSPVSTSQQSRIVNTVLLNNIKLEYFDADSDRISYFNSHQSPNAIDADEFNKIAFVSVKIVNYTHHLIFPPGIDIDLGDNNTDEDGDKVFAMTVLPRESLGVVCTGTNGSCDTLDKNHCPFS
jgi:hypothetical protein